MGHRWKDVVEMGARRVVGYALGPVSSRLQPWSPAVRRASLLTKLGVDLLIDVGANTGQYGAQVRLFGYRETIRSFEPLPPAYAALRRRADADGRWEHRPLGLARSRGTGKLHIAGNSQSSSLLPMLPRHVEAAPSSAFVGDVTVNLVTLADILDEVPAERRVFLKIDAQGSERNILVGGETVLERLVGLELELSLVPLYEGETLLTDMLPWLEARGFRLHAVHPGYCDPRTGAVLQVDILATR